MEKWFKEVRTTEELRKRHKELLKKHHPDNGGNKETMKEINAEYDHVSVRISHENKAGRGKRCWHGC